MYNLVLFLTFLLIYIVTNHVAAEAPHPCQRPCTGTPMTCHYNFTLETYYTVSRACYDCPANITDCFRPHCVTADGYGRGILTVNRQIPGPAIHVCEGDTIVVNVHNRFENGEGTSIHFHGIHQRGTPFMDGVAMLTQCPIPQGTRFQYRFTASPTGTHWWHAHTGVQRADGVYGALMVRSNKMAANAALYDLDLPEHAILLGDWPHVMISARVADYFHNMGSNNPENLLINGRGIGKTVTTDDNVTHEFPRAHFTVEQGQRYRFRLINVGKNCLMTFYIDNHTLTVIATETGEITPITIAYLIITPGERFDVIVNADQPVANYWMRLWGTGCQTSQTAVLRYEGSGDGLPDAPSDYASNIPNLALDTVNVINENGSPGRLPVSNLTSLDPDDDVMTGTPDSTFYIGMDFYRVPNYHYNHPEYYPIEAGVYPWVRLTQQLGGISNRLPPSPLLTQYWDVKDEICNPDTIDKDCSVEFCECTHVIKVRLGAITELVLIDEGVPFAAQHPMHLHGHFFRVMGMQQLGTSTTVEAVKALDQEGKLLRRTSGAPLKDTVTVPDGGYTIVRFKADNPGVWLFHCHRAIHNQIGMSLIIQVGEPRDFPTPPCQFPRCGDWRPTDKCDRNAAQQCGCNCSSNMKVRIQK